MRTPVTLVMLGLAALLLTACGKGPDGAPAPVALPSSPSAAPSIPTDTSMPSAAEIASAATNGTPVPVREAGRTNASLARTPGGTTAPVAGQNNDHSAPLASAAPASAPR